MTETDLNKSEFIEPLQGAIDYLDQVIENRSSVTVPLDNENYGLAFEELNNFIEGIDHLNQILYYIADILDINYENLSCKEETVSYYIDQFNSFLVDELIVAMENKDYMLLSDLINYELENYLIDYQKSFKKLINYLEKSDLNVGGNQ
jgi:hypothetical protein